MIKQYSLLALQTAINRTLSLDETMPTKMASFHGKVIEMVISPLSVHFFIQFHQAELRLLANYTGKPDTIIHSSPLGLIRLSLLPASKVRSLFNDKIRLSGDVELGQRVKALFDGLDIDWEGHLAEFTGDVVAHQVGAIVRKGLAFKTRLTQSMQKNLTEYLQEEKQLCPPREEVDYFFSEVDLLSLRVERLDARINQLLVRYETD